MRASRYLPGRPARPPQALLHHKYAREGSLTGPLKALRGAQRGAGDVCERLDLRAVRLDPAGEPNQCDRAFLFALFPV